MPIIPTPHEYHKATKGRGKIVKLYKNKKNYKNHQRLGHYMLYEYGQPFTFVRVNFDWPKVWP